MKTKAGEYCSRTHPLIGHPGPLVLREEKEGKQKEKEKSYALNSFKSLRRTLRALLAKKGKLQKCWVLG